MASAQSLSSDMTPVPASDMAPAPASDMASAPDPASDMALSPDPTSYGLRLMLLLLLHLLIWLLLHFLMWLFVQPNGFGFFYVTNAQAPASFTAPTQWI